MTLNYSGIGYTNGWHGYHPVDGKVLDSIKSMSITLPLHWKVTHKLAMHHQLSQITHQTTQTQQNLPLVLLRTTCLNRRDMLILWECPSLHLMQINPPQTRLVTQSALSVSRLYMHRIAQNIPINLGSIPWASQRIYQH